MIIILMMLPLTMSPRGGGNIHYPKGSKTAATSDSEGSKTILSTRLHGFCGVLAIKIAGLIFPAFFKNQLRVSGSFIRFSQD
jgi:hypothetical protein